MRPYEAWLTQPDGLAVRLRQLRSRAELTGKDLAGRLGWQQSKVSRLETGKTMPSREDVRAWARECGADAGAVDELLKILGDVETTYLDHKHQLRRGQAQLQVSYDELVRDAATVRNLETLTVPGLLQTGPYARGVIEAVSEFHGLDPGDVDDTVAARLDRQRVLYEPGRTFEFLMTETVLWQMFTTAEEMRGQLDRLQAAIGTPRVRVGIIPFTAAAVNADHSFLICDDFVVVETFAGSTTHEGSVAALYVRAMDTLWAQAKEGDDARALIAAAATALPASE